MRRCAADHQSRSDRGQRIRRGRYSPVGSCVRRASLHAADADSGREAPGVRGSHREHSELGRHAEHERLRRFAELRVNMRRSRLAFLLPPARIRRNAPARAVTLADVRGTHAREDSVGALSFLFGCIGGRQSSGRIDSPLAGRQRRHSLKRARAMPATPVAPGPALAPPTLLSGKRLRSVQVGSLGLLLSLVAHWASGAADKSVNDTTITAVATNGGSDTNQPWH